MLMNKGSRAQAVPGIAEVSLERPSLVIFLGVLVVIALVTTSPIAYWLLYALGSVIAPHCLSIETVSTATHTTTLGQR